MASSFTTRIPATIRDLDFESQAGAAVLLSSDAGPSLLERSTIRAFSFALSVGRVATIRDVELVGSGGREGLGLPLGATATLDRVVIHGWQNCVSGNGQDATIHATNLLVYDCSVLALNMPLTRGSIAFATIANSGTDTGTGPRAVSCGQQLTISSSIIWAPGATPRAPVSGCSLVSTIAGPTAVAGASNADPFFVNPEIDDFHLRPGSPARDMVETGPSLDFEGTARPQGDRFDIGADEALDAL